MAYALKLDFGSGWEDHSADLYGRLPFSRKRAAHSGLKPVISSLRFALVRDDTLVNRFYTSSADVAIQVLKDGAAWFTGFVRLTHKLRVGPVRSESFEVEAVSSWYRLEKKILFSETWYDYTVSNPSSTGTSLLHQLFVRAGFTLGSLSFPSIPIVIDRAVFKFGERSYREIVEKVLEETGYSAYVDASGVVRLYDLGPSSITTSRTLVSGPGGTIAEAYDVERRESSVDAVDVTVSSHKTLAGQTVFLNTTGGSAGSCLIVLAAGDYYPSGASVTTPVFADFKVQDYELIAVDSPAITWKHTGDVVLQVFTAEGRGAWLRFYSATGGVITQLKIDGAAIVAGDQSKSICENLVNAERRESLDCEWITTLAEADHLSRIRATWHKYGQYSWTFRCTEMDLEPGEYVQFSESYVFGASQVLRVLSIEDGKDERVLTVVAEGAGPYSALAVTHQSTIVQQTALPPSSDPAMDAYVNNYPPTNNITALVLLSNPNADGTVSVSVAWDYNQGDVTADGFLVFYRAEIETPSSIDLYADPNRFVAALPSAHYATTLTLPVRQGGVGSIPLHYRFGVVAVGTRSAGTIANTAGVVEDPAWIDVVFAGAITVNELNFWDQVTGELRAGAGNGWIHVDPATGRVEVAEIYASQFRATASLLLYAGGYANLAANLRVIGDAAPGGSRLWLFENSLADNNSVDDWSIKTGLAYSLTCRYGERAIAAAGAGADGILKLASGCIDLRQPWSLEWWWFAAADEATASRALTIADSRGNSIYVEMGLYAPSRVEFAAAYADGYWSAATQTDMSNLRIYVQGEALHFYAFRLPLKYFRYLALVEDATLGLSLYVDEVAYSLEVPGWLNPGPAYIQHNLRYAIGAVMDDLLLTPSAARTSGQIAASRASVWGYGSIPTADSMVLWAPGQTEMNAVRMKRGQVPSSEVDTAAATAGQVYNALIGSLDVVGQKMLVHGTANSVAGAWKAERLNSTTVRIYHSTGYVDVTSASSGGIYRMGW